MIAITLFLSFAIFANICLGITVFYTNRKRKTNQAYLAAATFMLLWLLSNLFILHSRTPEQAIYSINVASALAACIPSLFQLLRLTIKFQNASWPSLLKKSSLQLGLNLITILLCFLPSFTKSVRFSDSGDPLDLVQAEYGPPFIFFLLYMVGSIFMLGYHVFRDRKKLEGTQRLEIDFLVFACLSGLSVGIFFGTIVALVSHSTIFVPIANATSVCTVLLIVAYGISVHKILAVAEILRRIIAYALLTGYLTVVYLICWFFLSVPLKALAIFHALPVHIACTVCVVFSIAPVRSKIERAAGRLIAIKSTDIPAVIKASAEIFRSVTTSRALLSKFADLLVEAFSAKNLLILSNENSILTATYATDSSEHSISATTALPSLIDKTREPVCRDILARQRPTSVIKAAMRQLDDLNMSVAVGVFSKSDLTSVVLLSSRIGGRIYDKNEQDALQILCNQFAVAQENAQLYTEMQDSKIRNDIMLDQLVSGVIVADPERKIALINHEAQRITGLTEEDALGQGLDLLPESISRALESTLSSQSGLQNTDSILLDHEKEESTHVRLGSAYLLGHDNKPMGALLVFTDMTEVKGLEEQVRRSDQLSSVGTLAAGMAHEIKNPLVTIKTFTQLLPERYGDAEFRKDFSSLVAHEVARIDGIVNHLLNFSKPSQPHLVPMKLHGTVEKTLELIHEQLSQKNIALNNNLRARNDLISGDADLLTQTLVNFNLNAIEAIGNDGSISVSSSNCTYRFAHGDDPGDAVKKSCIRLQISDSGKGIEQDQLQKIFDPFFTSKSEGTGMGLSVAHGIIHEHHGVIEVDSRPGKGTTFSIYIPVLEEDTAA